MAKKGKKMTDQNRNHNNIETCGGFWFDLSNPDPAKVRIEDIAESLSRLCRYAGHCGRFYSVAEHSVRLTHLVGEKFKFEALLHDAVEAYLGDVVAPLKLHLPDYQKLETRAQAQISAFFGVPTKLSQVVLEADLWIRGQELHELFGWPSPDPHPHGTPPALDLDPDRGFVYFVEFYQQLRRHKWTT